MTDAMRAGATHPWELPGYTQPGSQAGDAQPDQPPSGDKVELPALRGPAFSQVDTLDPALLPGDWLQVCVVVTEKMNLVPAAEQDIMTFGLSGQALLHQYTGGELKQTIDGKWQKLRPGVLSLGFGEDPGSEIYAEIFGQWFLYIWSYDVQTGMWLVRLPPDRSAPPLGADYDTTRGKLHIAELNGTDYSGTVTGTSAMQVRGCFNAGVLSMRWEDPQNNAAGFAAFNLDPHSGALYGVWWVDNFTSAPFGGTWQATPPGAAPLPEDVQGVSVAGNPASLDHHSVKTL